MTLTGPLADNTAESTESAPGTGTFSLGGAVGTGNQTFVSAIGSGNVTIYAATDDDESNWEVGYGTVTDANPDTLTRTAVFASSNSGNKVNFATAPTVFIPSPAAVLNSILSTHSGTSRPAWLPANSLWIDTTSDLVLKFFDGTDDISILTIDATNNRFSLAAMLGDAELEDTDAGAGAGPEFVLYRNSASPADNDLLGILKFRGRNDNSQDALFAQIIAQALDVSDTTEDGQLLLQAIIAGTMTTIMAIGSNGVTVGSPTGGAPGAGGINAEALEINGAAVRAGLPRGHIAGLTLSNNSTDASHDIDVAVGEARDDDDTEDLILASAITKQIDASWAVGTDAGGLDGSESVDSTPDADTWYHVHLIKRTDTGVVDVLFSESATAPTLPTNYDVSRRIGAVLTDGSANIIAFSQRGDEFLFDASVADDTGSITDGNDATVTLTVPTGIVVWGIFSAIPVSTQVAYFNSLDQDAEAATLSLFNAGSNGAGVVSGPGRPIRTNTSAQIRVAVGNATGAVSIDTHGWIDRRGRDD